MPHTPMPEPLAIDPTTANGAAEETRARRRMVPAEARPVSDLARAHNAPAPARQLKLSHDELAFVTALHDAGLADELDGAELSRAAAELPAKGLLERRFDLLSAYYRADGDPIVSYRRRRNDRWFVYSARRPFGASALVAQINQVNPELGEVLLERVGGPEGALILRSGEHVCALEDELGEPAGGSSVSILDLIHAFNVLLGRRGVPARLVGLLGDGHREAYFAQTSLSSALSLADAGYLQVEDVTALMSLTAW